MAKFSRKEFADLAGVRKDYVATYIRRGNIIETDEGIDDQHPMNQKFLAKRNGGGSIREMVETVRTKIEPGPEPEAEKPTEKKQRKPRERETGVDPWTQLVLDLERKTKQAEYDKKQQEIELNKLKLAKLRGEVIPTDLVRVIFTQHFKSVTTAFHQGADGFISTIAKRAGLPKDELAVLRGELIEIVNKGVADAIEDSKSSLRNIVNEYSQRRGVGERK